ncbi:AGAP011666-PA-like protein [Anopheles sinensis]|uniref:AGAP011666-PA-like protein n=1 Tax=Anopheles sinensis TaxID=74873 RepID=A0A084VIC4_ANOSI|nr:AGAP011666-PA-like protein [Anopheles sinensis]
MQCSEFTVRHACGDETALFTRKFLDKMSNTLMRRHAYQFRSVEFLIKYLRAGPNGATLPAYENVNLIAPTNTKADDRGRS